MPEPVKALGRTGAEVMEPEPWENLAAKLSQTLAKQLPTAAFGPYSLVSSRSFYNKSGKQ